MKLDDTATWLGTLDYALEHGTRVTGLAPSSYEAMLTFWLGDPDHRGAPSGGGGQLEPDLLGRRPC